MAEQKTTQAMETKKNDVVETKNASATPASTETKVETKKETKPAVAKKTEATARGDSVRASKRHCMYICTFIKGKKVDQAIAELEQVVKLKRAIPFKGEIPHRKGKGMMSGRYPVDASKIMIAMLKGLRGNIIANGMDLDKTVIVEGVSNWAARPQKRAGGRGKRTHVTLTAREVMK